MKIKKTMKEKTIIKELFEDIEKFGWNVVSTKINFYLNKEKEQMEKSFTQETLDFKYGIWENFEQYYNNTYGEEESK